ncbi:hypothetical protein AAZX31_13G005600 [Glycine max]
MELGSMRIAYMKKVPWLGFKCNLIWKKNINGFSFLCLVESNKYLSIVAFTVCHNSQILDIWLLEDQHLIFREIWIMMDILLPFLLGIGQRLLEMISYVKLHNLMLACSPKKEKMTN